MCNCQELENIYDGYAVEEIPKLVPFVEEVGENLSKWEVEYVCRDCGQKWLEKYVSSGHGDVPQTKKL